MSGYGGDQFPPGEEEFYQTGKLKFKPFWQRHLKIIAFGIAVLMVVLTSIIIFLANRPSPIVQEPTPTSTPTAMQGVTPTPTATFTPTPTPSPEEGVTPTPTPVPTQVAGLPCNVNIDAWSTGAADWKVLKGKLLNDGSSNTSTDEGPTIVAPCDLGAATNYAVEAKIKVISEASYPCFGITVRGTPVTDAWQGYKVGIGTCYDGLKMVRITGPEYSRDNASRSVAFAPGTEEHTYRVEARDNSIKLFIDKGLLLTLPDNRYLTGTEVGLWDRDVQLEVSSFKITAL